MLWSTVLTSKAFFTVTPKLYSIMQWVSFSPSISITCWPFVYSTACSVKPEVVTNRPLPALSRDGPDDGLHVRPSGQAPGVTARRPAFLHRRHLPARPTRLLKQLRLPLGSI